MKCSCTMVGQKYCGSCGCKNNPKGPAYRASGQYCGGSANPTTFRCHMHGGQSPQNLLQAQQAMALLRMPAIEHLFEVLDMLGEVIEQYRTTRCGTCGYPSGSIDELNAVTKACAVICKTAQTVLDRADVGPRATLEIKQTDGDLDLKMLTDYERNDLMSAVAEVRAAKEKIRARLMGAGPGQVSTTIM